MFGTDPDHEYNGLLFPDVAETLTEAHRRPDSAAAWARVRRALAAAVFVVNAASAALREPAQFARPWTGREGPGSAGDAGGRCRHWEL